MSRFPCLLHRPCRNVCTGINTRMERKTAVYQRDVRARAPASVTLLMPRCSCVYDRTARMRPCLCVRADEWANVMFATLFVVAPINTSVTPITQRGDRDVLSRENRNYPPLFSFPLCHLVTREPSLPLPIAPKFRIISATVAARRVHRPLTDY